MIYCVCLDCAENRLCLASAFFSWVPCTVHRTRKYEKRKSNFNTKSHNTIHIFKSYFATVFSVISFQFSTIRYTNTPIAFFCLYLVSSKLLLIGPVPIHPRNLFLASEISSYIRDC